MIAHTSVMEPGKKPAETAEPRRRMNFNCVFIWILTLVLVGSQVPIFVQQTLTPDTVLYDLQARCLLNGGVLYRDILEPNLPGIVWVHAIVRSFIGWLSMALLVFDLFVVLAIGLLLAKLVRTGAGRSDESQAMIALTLPGVLLFYFGTSEWCHGQRDTWMLLPCLVAVLIRVKVLQGLKRVDCRLPRFSFQQFGWGTLEGIFWAIGFWLKPFVAVPALAVQLVSIRYSSGFRSWSLQLLSVLFGGLLTGAAGIALMVQSGCWTYFWDQLTQWNGDYFQSGRTRWTLDRFVDHAMRFQPWIWLHVGAIAISVRQLIAKRTAAAAGKCKDPAVVGNLLGALYLGWILQAFIVQQLFDYIHVPGVLLAWAICIRSAAAALTAPRPLQTAADDRATWKTLTLPAFAAFLCLALVVSPMVRWNRQQLWLECVQACSGSALSPQSKDQIAQFPFPRWTELQPMIEHLREAGIADKALIAYNGNLIHLYPELGIPPVTRFVYLDVLARSFPGRRSEMIAALERSAVRFVVSDLREDGWEGDLPTNGLLPASLADRQSSLCFPYNQTPVFRSGGYVLFQIDHPVERLSEKYVPLSLLPEGGGNKE